MKKSGDGDPIGVEGTLATTGGSQEMEPSHKFASTISQEFIYSINTLIIMGTLLILSSIIQLT